ncbi:MAG: amidohydrolase family protein, partial [Opitutaceae bacterium]
TPVWLRVGALFTGDDSGILRDAHFVYDATRILHSGTQVPPRHLLGDGQTEPDAHWPNHTLLPGLIEAHAHLFLEGGQENPERRAAYLKLSDAELAARAEDRLSRLLRIGITAVRDAGDRNGVGLALQRRYRSSDRGAMPYLDSPGAAIHHQGRYGAFMGRPIEEHGSLEACVAARARDGAHRIKLLATGIINFDRGAVTTKPQLPADELTRAVVAARGLGKQTMIHCSGRDGVAHCIDARVDTIEHGFFIDDEQLVRLRELDIAWVPTFAPVQFQVDHAAELGWSDAVRGNLQRILDRHAASLARAAQLGVRIVAGSDAGSHGVAHGHGFLWELELMERAGLSTVQVLRAATGASASRLAFAEEFGRLRPGAKPRFLLTSAPVLDGVRHLRAPLTTVFDGAVYSGGDDPAMSGL